MPNGRITRTLRNLEAMGESQILVCDPMSIYYLTGQMHYPGERLLMLYLTSSGRHTLYLNELCDSLCDVEGVEIKQFKLGEDMVGYVADKLDKSAPLGVDKEMPARFLAPLLERSGIAKFIVASEAVDKARQLKDASEREYMEKSSAINDAAIERFVKLIHEGVRESEVRSQLSAVFSGLGSDNGGGGIVAFGESTSEAHYFHGDKELKPGDAVLFDCGCRYNHYCSDITRTFFYKTVTDYQRKVYGIVRAANEAAESFIRPGVSFAEADKAARDVIDQAGFGKYFVHRLGHSIGLEGHEYGDVSALNHNTIEEGMTFTVEPGIYLPGEFGVRIEDVVLVTKNGCQPLNHYSKDLIIIE